jgi:uncharacterized membrane-anchored protein
VPRIYWLVVVLISVVGTLGSDSEGLSLGYFYSALMFAAVIGIVTIAH